MAVDGNGNLYKVINIKNGIYIIVTTAEAPFKSQIQLNVTTNRTEDKDGISAGMV